VLYAIYYVIIKTINFNLTFVLLLVVLDVLSLKIAFLNYHIVIEINVVKEAVVSFKPPILLRPENLQFSNLWT
jgi:hypothetical protein